MGKVKNFNVPVSEAVSTEFERWCETLPGKKGDKLTGAVRAIQAIHLIDQGLAYELMKPELTNQKAAELIRSKLSEIEYQSIIDSLSPLELARLHQLGQPDTGKPSEEGKGKKRK
jgi:hypothetical protein